MKLSERFKNISFFTQMVCISVLSVDCHEKCGNAADILDNHVSLTIYLLSFTKMICLRLRLTKIHDNCFKARSSWTSVTDSSYIYINGKLYYTKRLKSIYYLKSFTGCFIVAGYVLNPVFQPRENASNLPLLTFCTFINVSYTMYISLYFLQRV